MCPSISIIINTMKYISTFTLLVTLPMPDTFIGMFGASSEHDALVLQTDKDQGELLLLRNKWWLVALNMHFCSPKVIWNTSMYACQIVTIINSFGVTSGQHEMRQATSWDAATYILRTNCVLTVVSCLASLFILSPVYMTFQLSSPTNYASILRFSQTL